MGRIPILTTLIVILVLATGGLILIPNKVINGKIGNSGASHIVNYDADQGYTPSEIKIKKGDTVVFKNNSDKYFWPASDIHPTHGIYPEFDPQDAVPPGDSWTFRFNKQGTWRFHDHLSPYYTGRIIVE